MRVFIVIVCFIVCLEVQGQDRVCLPKEVASFYLETLDELEVYYEMDSTKSLLITNMEFTISTKDLMIKNLEIREKSLNQIIEIKNKELQLSDEQIKILKKQIRRERTKTVMVAIGSGALLILALI